MPRLSCPCVKTFPQTLVIYIRGWPACMQVPSRPLAAPIRRPYKAFSSKLRIWSLWLWKRVQKRTANGAGQMSCTYDSRITARVRLRRASVEKQSQSGKAASATRRVPYSRRCRHILFLPLFDLGMEHETQEWRRKNCSHCGHEHDNRVR